MAIEITIPRLGWSMDEGIFAGWLKNDGDSIHVGEALFSLEGEKATQDVEAIDSGILHIPKGVAARGDTVLVGAVIGFLLQRDEATPNSDQPATTPKPSLEAPMIQPEVTIAHRNDRARSSPLARRIAQSEGIDWTQISGSGSSGRIRRADVLEAVRIRKNSLQAILENSSFIPVSLVRRTIASRMIESHRTTAPVTLTTSVDVTNLTALRRQFKAVSSEQEVPSYNDFLIKLLSIALHDHPLLNARWIEGEDRITLQEQVNIGIAIDTEAGLFVPVISDAARLGLRQIATLTKELIRRVRERQLRRGDCQGGTFTMTNLGALGVETFTPIINLPECAILGVGKMERRPVMDGDRVVGQERMNLSLTFDHRVVDGAPAARFLQQLTKLIENPGPWLMP